MHRSKTFSKRNGLKLFILSLACLLFAGFGWSSRINLSKFSEPRDKNESVDYGDLETARAAFVEAYPVFMSPRCANCHPAGDVPTQGDMMLLHTQGITRGKDGKGVYGMKCTTCHQKENLDGDHLPPGVSTEWHMPPADMKMVFQGRTAKQLCLQLKDPKQNGGRKTPEEAINHLEEDPIVHWGWSPGNGRTTPPLSYEVFLAKMKEWAGNGGTCPE
jgi:hypothetical protein